MRILLAIDGSITSDRARAFVAKLNLPAETEIRVIAVLDHVPTTGGIDWHADLPGSTHGSEGQRAHLTTALETASQALETAGHAHVDSVLLRGEPAKAIIDEARDFEADLVVVGHRGLGAVKSMFLGSTSTAVLEHAPCQVLVVREPNLRNALLAEDGSESSRQATEAVARWPIFNHLPITVVTVVSVADVRIPATMEVQLGLYDQVLKSYIETADIVRAQTREITTRAAQTLTEAGRDVTIDVREGPPASAIVEAAVEHQVDLIVIGTRGHTGLARIALGGTARSVMLHAPCSVLIVRGRVDAATETASEPAPGQVAASRS
jgi:nucleotide-binding universal stress UspA family protein